MANFSGHRADSTGHFRIAKKNALSMGEVISLYIREMKLSSGLNTRRIFSAWDDVSGAAQFTLKKFFRDGRLYITLSSSVIRNQLSFQKIVLLEKINEYLSNDDLFVKDCSPYPFVHDLILK